MSRGHHHFLCGVIQDSLPEPSVRQTTTDTGSSTSGTVNLTSAPINGSRLIMCIAQVGNLSSPVASSISQTGVTWTRLSGTWGIDGVQGQEMWYTDIIDPSVTDTSISITFTDNAVYTAVCTEVRYLALTDIIQGSTVDSYSFWSTSCVPTTPFFNGVLEGGYLAWGISVDTSASFPSASDNAYFSKQNAVDGTSVTTALYTGTGQNAGTLLADTISTLGAFTNYTCSVVEFRRRFQPRATVAVPEYLLQIATNSTTSVGATMDVTLDSTPNQNNFLVAWLAAGSSKSSTTVATGISSTNTTWNKSSIGSTVIANELSAEMWIGTFTGVPGTTVTITVETAGLATAAIIAEVNGTELSSSPTDTGAADNSGTGKSTTLTGAGVTSVSTPGYIVAGGAIGYGKALLTATSAHALVKLESPGNTVNSISIALGVFLQPSVRTDTVTMNLSYSDYWIAHELLFE